MDGRCWKQCSLLASAALAAAQRACEISAGTDTSAVEHLGTPPSRPARRRLRSPTQMRCLQLSGSPAQRWRLFDPCFSYRCLHKLVFRC